MAMVKVKNKFVDDSIHFEFRKKGDFLEGVLVDRVRLTKGRDTFLKYVVDHVDGSKMSFLGSYQLDLGLSEMPLNTLIRVTYTGSTNLGHGKAVKNFDIEMDADYAA